jgi:hypothetical protein
MNDAVTASQNGILHLCGRGFDTILPKTDFI